MVKKTLSAANPYETQVNRKHIKKKEKLEKKKRFKKNRSKIMDERSELRKVKKMKDIMRKMGLMSERFQHKVHCDEIIVMKQILEKMMN